MLRRTSQTGMRQGQLFLGGAAGFFALKTLANKTVTDTIQERFSYISLCIGKQQLSVAQSCLTAARQAPLSMKFLKEEYWSGLPFPTLPITNSWSLPKLMCSESVMPSNHLILCCPPLLPPSIFPSIREPPPARGAGTLIPSAQRLVWAAKQPLGNAALGALFA